MTNSLYSILATSLLLSVFMLSACSTLLDSEKQNNASDKSLPQDIKTAAPIESELPPITYSSFSTETLYSLMLAELAAGRKQYGITLDNYVKEAYKTNDLGVITRAARLAQYFRDTDQTLAMAKLWQAKAPDDIESNAVIATAYIDKRQPLQALNYAEKIFDLNSANENNKINRAAITETIANFSRDLDTLTKETLISRYQGLIQRYPTYTPIKVGLSILYESQRDTAQAYKTIESAILQDENYLPARMQQIRLLQSSNQTELAIDQVKELLVKQPDNGRLRLLYARLLTQTDINAAYAEFTRLAQLSPGHLDIQFSRALIALEIKKYDVAEKILTSLLNKRYQTNTVNYYLGNLAQMNKDENKALTFYRKVTTGQDFVVAQSKAASILARQGKIEEAQANFKELRQISPNHRPELYQAEAGILDANGKASEAIDIISKAIDEFPDNVNLRYNRSSYYEKNDQLDLMENDLRHALTIEPKNPSILNALGYFLTSRTKRHQEAFELIKNANILKPNDPAIMDSMGWVLFNIGRIEEAISYLKKAFELFPDPEIAAHLGEALWIAGDKQEARAIWTENLKMNPNDKRIIDTMERLQVKPSI